jgi:nuclear pore complex protein Nup93
VARNVGVVLKMAVQCCTQLAAELRNSPYSDANKIQKLNELKARTKSAMIYAGMIQFKLPAHIYAFLNQCEVSE